MNNSSDTAAFAALDSLEMLAVYGGVYGDEMPDIDETPDDEPSGDDAHDWMRYADEDRDETPMYGHDEPYDEYGQGGCCGDF